VLRWIWWSTANPCFGDGAQPRGWALLAADRVASKRTRAWKRKRQALKICAAADENEASRAGPAGPARRLLSFVHLSSLVAARDALQLLAKQERGC